jgi:hypothetical protein
MPIGVAGLDAIGNGETQRANMVSDHPKRHVHALLLGLAGGAGRRQGRAVPLAA